MTLMPTEQVTVLTAEQPRCTAEAPDAHSHLMAISRVTLESVLSKTGLRQVSLHHPTTKTGPHRRTRTTVQCPVTLQVALSKHLPVHQVAPITCSTTRFWNVLVTVIVSCIRRKKARRSLASSRSCAGCTEATRRREN